MKKILFVLASLFLFAPAMAQLPLILDEQFNAPNPGWYWSDVDDENNYRKIRNGVLYHEQRAPNTFWTLHSANINPRKDFKIEAKFKALEPMKDGMYCIILNGDDNFYVYFGINPESKTYWIGSEQNGSWLTYSVSDAKSDAIQGGLNDNVMAVDVKGSKMSFVINGTTLEGFEFKEKAPLLHSFIHYVGMATSAPMKTETDYYKIYQDYPIVVLTTERLDLKKKRLSSAVNTPLVEKWPVISPDGKSLFFARAGDDRNIGGKDSDDIWMSTATSDTSWANAVCMPKPLNNGTHNTVMSVTPDNNTLFLMHMYNADGTFKAAGFSISSRTVNGWSTPQDIVMHNYYNDGSTNEFYLSSDRKIMILGIKRKDTEGQNDLYVSRLQDDGSYSEPKNMGTVINTFGAEITPFLAADERTLYFGSDGHPGYGSSDIFVSKRLDDTWLNWSMPRNLGPEINSANWEGYFTMPASGAYAYVAAAESGAKLDLYRLDLPRIFRPEPVIIVSGKVIDTKTKKPVDAAVLYSDLLNTEKPGKAMANPADGSYKIALPAGKNYAFLAQKTGYYAVSENLDLTNLKEYNEITKDLYVTPIEAGQVVRLNNIFFDFNKSELKKESFQELDRVIELFATNPGLVIEVGGHTDNVGDDAYNLKLSQSRSDAVMKYIISKGIPAARVTAKGHGESKPLTVNTTDAGRATNRRVEFTILHQ